MKTRLELELFLEQFNTSELLSIVVFNEFPGVHRVGPSKGIPREVLIDMLIEFRPMPDTEALTSVRQRSEAFVKRYWQKLKGQAPDPQCPECILGKIDRGKMLRCSDMAAAVCFTRNEEHYRG